MSEWISVKDRLPENNSPFIGTDGNIIFCAYWCDVDACYQVAGWESCCYCGGSSKVSFNKTEYHKLCTHWMPLPKLPKRRTCNPVLHAAECDECGEHALECRCRKNIFSQPPDDSIDVYITMNEFDKINRFADFLPTYLYASSEPTARKELGKIQILGGPILRFHKKRPEIPTETHEELLHHRPVP